MTLFKETRIDPVLWTVIVLGMLVSGCKKEEPGVDSGKNSGRIRETSKTEVRAPWFEECAVDRGLEFRHRSGHSERFLFPEIMGGGAALFDMDGDGDLDAYFVQSGSLTSDADRPGNQLFRNVGGGRFENVSQDSGASDRGYGMGAACGDYDNDGDEDIYVTNVGANVLLRNDGNGRFSDVTAAAGVGDAGWGASAAFFDADGDGDLDLFVVNYILWSVESEIDCFQQGGPGDYCSP
jgi:hypothetical protein